MKLVLGEVDRVFSLGARRIPSLVIEHPACFRRTCLDLAMQCEGEEGDSVLSVAGRTVPFAKYGELVRDFAPFSLRKKPFLHALQGYLERRALEEGQYEKTQDLLASLERWVYDLSDDLPIQLIGKLTPASLIKAASLLPEEAAHPLEAFLDYMEVWREMGEDRLFVAVQMRSYFSEEDLVPFFQTVAAKQYRLFLLDSQRSSLLPWEDRYVVDVDMCEYEEK